MSIRAARAWMPLIAAAVLALSSGPPAAALAGDAGPACDGRWAVVPTPSVGSILNALLAVDAPAAGDAWAVGFEGHIDHHEFVVNPVIQHWNGATWRSMKAPVEHGILAGVRAFGADDVWAVGHSGLSDDPAPLALHWDGAAWTEMPTPPVERGYLLGIDGVAPDDLWAVGVVVGTFETIALHWDGAAWTLVEHPSPQSDYVSFGAISAAASDDAWIVGDRLGPDAVSLPFAEHWNGTAWRTVQVPQAGEAGTTLSRVLALGPSEAWAAGSAQAADGTTRPLLMRWDGAAWTETPLPAAGAAGALGGLALDAGGRLWAAGTAGEAGRSLRTLVLRSTAAGWARSPSPNASRLDNRLLDLATGGDGDQWAVGFYQEPGVNRTLALHRCG